jgi:hypothetical protein
MKRAYITDTASARFPHASGVPAAVCQLDGNVPWRAAAMAIVTISPARACSEVVLEKLDDLGIRLAWDRAAMDRCNVAPPRRS